MTGHPLDTPFWSALSGAQADLATGGDLAKRYMPDVSTIAGVPNANDASLDALGALIPAGGGIIVPQAFEIGCPEGVTRSVAMAWQLVAREDGPETPRDLSIVALNEADWPDMLALAKLTNPGPFMLRTPMMGRFWGVQANGVLIAMGGERARLTDYIEISAICTHPDHRGSGLGTAMCLHVRDQIRAAGKTPFLHAYQSNTAAIRLYQSLGFQKRCEIYATSFSKP